MNFPTPPPTDSLRRVLDSVFAGPDYQWVQPPRPLAFLGRWWDRLGSWLDHFQATNPQLFEYFFWGLILLLVLIFVHGGYVLARTLRTAAAGEHPSTAVPRPDVRDVRWHRREADRLAGQGRYAEACQAAFLALVLDLDDRSLVRFHPSKTPNEYTYEGWLAATERERLRELVRALYTFAFAGRPCGAEDYRAWRELAAGEWRATAH